MDFERALDQLTEVEQIILMLTYCERQRQYHSAEVMQRPIRKVSYILPRARKRLADLLDRMDLL
jgi:DNA-directed RNA polymerase specialized sigma24 family protein